MAKHYFPEKKSQKTGISTYESTLFPAPAAHIKKIMKSMQILKAQVTDVSHGSIEGRLNQNTSTSRKLHHESTMTQFRHVEIREQCCDSSTDPGEKATLVGFPAIHHLQSDPKLSGFSVGNCLIEE